MNIGLLNIKITFQKRETLLDEAGNHANTWTDYYGCHATVSGEGGKQDSDVGLTVAFTVRYCMETAQIDITGFRIIFHDEIYDIQSIDHMNFKKKAMKFRCKKVRR